jgi:DNA helicase-2/ATP-dependent DNA helicase PcrA
VFFDEVRDDPDTEELTPAEMPQESPLLARLGELAVWPPDPPNRLRRDDAFPDGYPAALEDLLAGAVSPEEHLGRLDPAARLRAEELLAVHRGVAAALVRSGEDARAPLLGWGAALPQSVSATQVAGLLSEKIRPGDLTRPLPRRPSEAARIGVEVHRWIEEQARGLTGLADEEAFDVPSAPLAAARAVELRETWVGMGYGLRRIARLDSGEPMAELPFVLKVGDRLVRGRIDAVYETDGDGLEIVDFKTGGRVEFAGVDQLALYAAALSRLGVAFRGPLTLTYCYLADGTRDSRTITQFEADAALAAMEARLAQAG